MAKLETRIFGRNNEVKHLLIVPESEEESQMIDEMLGNKRFPISVTGDVCLSDGFGQHYIRVMKPEKGRGAEGE